MEKERFESVLDREGSFAWYTRGGSMAPLLKTHRDVVQISRKTGPLAPYDVAFYTRRGPGGSTGYVLHRVLALEPGGYLISGDHNLTLEHVPEQAVLGVMTGLVRAGRQVDLQGWRYRAYVTLWAGHFRRRVAVLRVIRGLKAPLRPLVRRLRGRKKT